MLLSKVQQRIRDAPKNDLPRVPDDIQVLHQLVHVIQVEPRMSGPARPNEMVHHRYQGGSFPFKVRG